MLHTLNVYHNRVFVSLDNRDSHAVLKVVKLLKIKIVHFTKAVKKKLDRADFGELRKHLLSSTS